MFDKNSSIYSEPSRAGAPRFLAMIGLLIVASWTAGCSVISIDGEGGGRGVRAEGLVDGFLVGGWSAEERYLNVRVLGGSSSGALAEIVLWKLARLEVGAAGISMGVLPLHMGLGTLFYEPRVPCLIPFEQPEKHDHEAEDDED